MAEIVTITHICLFQPVILTSRRQHDDQIINIACKLVGDVMPGNPQYLQFFNLMLRSYIGNLNLQMVKRDFYDPENKVRRYVIPEFPLYRRTRVLGDDGGKFFGPVYRTHQFKVERGRPDPRDGLSEVALNLP